MRLTRKTVAALGLSGALTVMGGVLASAAVLNLPILGFGEAATQAAAPPRVIHRTVYDDHYVTANTAPKAPAAGSPASKAAPGAPATTTEPTAGTAAPAGGPAFVAATAPAAPAGTAPAAPSGAAPSGTAPAAPAGTAPAAPATTQPEVTPPPPSGRPPVPAGCREPEWDSEHQAWHCSNGESGDE
jgi:hypothetical protein